MTSLLRQWQGQLWN